MISSLSYTVTFRATGRTLAETLSFRHGTTAITGPNEAGKSFVVEMIRYALFGSAALRGIGQDYEQLSVKIEFGDYTIERSPKGGSVRKREKILATGTRALNAKVVEVLGFGLDVFDVARVCNQGDVERLGAMPASERKAMVDRVIGVQRIEGVQKAAAERCLLLDREVEVLARALVEPEEPARPLDYDDPETLADALQQLRVAKEEHDRLMGWLSRPMAAPEPPQRPAGDATIEALEQEAAAIRLVDAQRRRVEALPVVDFDVAAVERQWSEYDCWSERQQFVARHPRPEIDERDLTAERELFERARRRAELCERRQRHANGQQVTCPECGAKFPLAHDLIADIDRQLAAIGDIEREPRDELWLRQQETRAGDWRTPETQEGWERVKNAEPSPLPAVERASLARAKISGGRFLGGEGGHARGAAGASAPDR